MERLTKYELCEGGIPLVIVNDEQSALQKLAMYEDLIEQGLLVRLPCKPREVVWVYYPKYKEIERIAYMTQSEILEDIELGAIICKTREEAEAALKGGKDDV